MKFTLSWLKDHLETTESLDQITDRLTKLGLEVESVLNLGDQLKGFKVAEILSAAPHPQADRLQVCQVDYGQGEPIQIVCGAPNARSGIKVVLGLPGSYVPALDFTLKVTKIRGVDSYGMLCSSKELGLGDEENGILELSQEAPLGAEFATYAGLDDPVIEVSVTPNRPDCLGVRGIARDLAAAGCGYLKQLETPVNPVSFKNDLPVTLDPVAAKGCPHYMGRALRGLKNRPSPAWLQRRLKAIGLRPISAIVDVTNYVSFDLCRPLHAFDFSSIDGELAIRLAKAEEAFSALNGSEYSLDSTMVVIADRHKVLALGGIMGGATSGCTLETEQVFLECAYFNPLDIAMAGRKLNLHSDSRYRLERGVDPLMTRVGLERATQLIIEICGGEASDIVDLGKTEFAHEASRPHIPFDLNFLEKRTGVSLDKETASKILKNLGFVVSDNDTVVPPSWRPDVRQSVDVVEEVIRVYGYEHLPEVPLPPAVPQTLNTLQLLETKLRHLLAARSFMEVITWSMVSSPQFRLFGGQDENLRIVNPITVDLEYLRPSVLIHLLKAVQQNLDRGLSPLSFFEIGPRYSSVSSDQNHTFVPCEALTLAGVCMGTRHAYHWSKQERKTDVFDLKAHVVHILEQSGVPLECVEFCSGKTGLRGDEGLSRSLPSWYHPGRSVFVNMGNDPLRTSIGVLGEVHPLVLKEFGIKERVYAFEIDLVSLNVAQSLARKTHKKEGLSLSPFQRVERDFSFLFDKSVKAGDIITTLRTLDPSVVNLEIFDVYEGPGVPDQMKSVSIHMVFEPKDHTFSDAEIKTLYDRVVKSIQRDLQGTLRL